MRILSTALVFLAFLAPTVLAETPGNPHFDVDRFLAKKLAGWQTRLQLDDWKIEIAPTRRDDLKKKTIGGIQWDQKKKTASIQVLHPADYEIPHAEMLLDLERTIVHELVHLELSALPHRESTRTSEEAAVNRIAEALLATSSQ